MSEYRNLSAPLQFGLIGLLVWSLIHSPAQAWNATGHKIVASIAFRQLTAAEQARIVDLLKRHPRFAEDFAEEIPDEVRTGEGAMQNEWLFQQAAVWPDLIRPPGAEAKTAFHRGQWHYINVPQFLDEAARAELQQRIAVNIELLPPAEATTNTERLNVVQLIRLARRECAAASADPQSRGLLLAWLFHDVGDLHQPLHGAALFSRRLFPEGDRGGNSVKLKQSFNLHSLWDQFPGAAADFKSSRDKAIGYVNGDLATVGQKSAAALDEKDWLDESYAIAKEAVYDAEVLAALKRMEATGGGVEALDLSENYLKAGGRIAERRIVQAGFRLGAVLKTIAAE